MYVANTSVKSSTKSKKTLPVVSRQPSVPDAAQALTVTDEPSFKNDTAALKCSLILLQHFSQAMISHSQLKMIFSLAVADAKKAGVEDVENNFRVLSRAVLRERYRNPMNAALDSMGNFW